MCSGRLLTIISVCRKRTLTFYFLQTPKKYCNTLDEFLCRCTVQSISLVFHKKQSISVWVQRHIYGTLFILFINNLKEKSKIYNTFSNEQKALSHDWIELQILLLLKPPKAQKQPLSTHTQKNQMTTGNITNRA